MMAWPDDLNNINSNMNTTELWALKEQMESQDWTTNVISSFAEYTTWTMTIHGTEYKFTEFYEMINEIFRLET